MDSKFRLGSENRTGPSLHNSDPPMRGIPPGFPEDPIEAAGGTRTPANGSARARTRTAIAEKTTAAVEIANQAPGATCTMSAAPSGFGRRPRQCSPYCDEELPPAKTMRAGEGQRQAAFFFGNPSGAGTIHESKPNPNDHSGDAWTEEQHKDFVSAVFEIGLRNASPAVILENMTQKAETITSERVKSKLQKYRSEKNRRRSREDFLASYSSFLERARSLRAEEAPSEEPGVSDGSLPTPIDPLRQWILRGATGSGGPGVLLGGDAAGYLTYAVAREAAEEAARNDPAGGPPPSPSGGPEEKGLPSTATLKKGARDYAERYAGSAIRFPVLTEAEKKSSLGIAMTFLAGLFLTLSQHLTRERARAETIGLKLPAPSGAGTPDATTRSATHATQTQAPSGGGPGASVAGPTHRTHPRGPVRTDAS
ncbi:unnamed protein product [Pseudo-nitzschia multistriata]|uniref:Myb-like domain-containing protein n=1 Tax=Pseudo-nitzschia multistriata TaxID=183589 RepID=A0A448ZJF8_9STRA|nr:unnamed protein product [Pseudo-nitzschia multistriata]